MLTLDVMGPLTLPVDLPVPPFGIVTRNQKARIRKQMRHGDINQLPNGSFDKNFYYTRKSRLLLAKANRIKARANEIAREKINSNEMFLTNYD